MCFGSSSIFKNKTTFKNNCPISTPEFRSVLDHTPNKDKHVPKCFLHIHSIHSLVVVFRYLQCIHVVISFILDSLFIAIKSRKKTEIKKQHKNPYLFYFLLPGGQTMGLGSFVYRGHLRITHTVGES